MCPALTTPFMRAISPAAPTKRVEQRQLVRHRGEAVEVDERHRERSGEASLSARNTRSQGMNTSSNTVRVSSILWRDEIGRSQG